MFCKGVVGEWEEGDTPLTEHKKHFPHCPFICDLPVGNIPIKAAAISSLDYGLDICGIFEGMNPCKNQGINLNNLNFF